MMNDDQRFFRFIIPGFASLTVTGLAFAITFPRVLCYVTQLELGGWITAIIGSGGLGFLLSQSYFAFRCSLVDYRQSFNNPSLVAHFRSMIHWDSSRASEDAWDQAKLDKRTAYNLGTFLWQKLIADREKALNGTTSRAASRMAAVGATWLGVALGFVGFVVWCSVRWVHALWFWFLNGFLPAGACTCRPLLGAAVFIVVLAVLWLVHRRLRELNQRLVELGLATYGLDVVPVDAAGDPPT
jgi:hypothetical protein